MSEPSSSWGVAEPAANWRLVSGDLLDVNLWVGLCSAAHPFHAEAMRYWESACSAATPLWFCWPTHPVWTTPLRSYWGVAVSPSPFAC